MPYDPVTSSVLAQRVTVGPPPPPPPGAGFNQLVVVAMENKNLFDVYNNGAAPYLNSLPGKCTHWRSDTNPSQPNYITVIGGQDFGISGDGNHPQLNHPTIVDIIEGGGRTWRAFAENASGSGAGLNPPRSEDHFPWLSYVTITQNPSRAANLQSGGPAQVLAAFNAGTNFIWLTPTDSHNMHDNSVSSGDSWVQSWLPGLLSAMVGKRAIVILWWDEGYNNPPYMPLFLAGPIVKPLVSTTEFIHPSLIKLLEVVWGGGNLGQQDVTANAPTEFLQ